MHTTGHIDPAGTIPPQPLAIVPPFQLLSLLPPPLLARTASHLDVMELLRLQRCSSAQYRLRADDAYMTAAWCSAELHVSLDNKLLEWTLPYEQCVEGDQHQCFVPASMWQAALPVWRAVVARTEGDETDQKRRTHERRAQLVQQEQLTMWTLAKRDARGRWRAVNDESPTEQSAGVQRVEVLRDIDWWWLQKEGMHVHHDVDVRCRSVLQACPYLQWLRLVVDGHKYQAPSHADTFALVPRLRVLSLEQCDSDPNPTDLLFDFRAMLDSLPHLHTLCCTDLRYLGIPQLLDIASHSTLDDVDLMRDCGIMGDAYADLEWIGYELQFPISEEEDEEQMEAEEAIHERLDGDAEEEDSEATETALVECLSADSEQLIGSADEQKELETVRAELQRMCAALTRTQPSQLSCEMRLALADWLHRRLRRGKLRADENASWFNHPKLLLHRYRMQVALLRSTLQRQLNELAASTMTSTDDEPFNTFESELGNQSKRPRVEK